MKRFAPAVVDALLVIIFSALGLISHDESVLAGLPRTAWPFVVGLLVGWGITWVIARGKRFEPVALWPSGIVIWASTLVGGMVLRAVSGQGTAVSFMIVAATVLALFLLGWRAAVRVLR
ncbi:DUF3054 domain-containing protein [Nocardia caishijiensis]|uniref:DUF3054 family protein n=1 Tax=Nocardia caishijiensis TaxID=184756 RepID=A0ABQ6YU41_9NOCA|nr:DUF3054 domain-containing protein [Nocardia caishijiensis]KAF0849327.1 hypothetical protein FNL39_101765 [Nocardia caishijiensis]